MEPKGLLRGILTPPFDDQWSLPPTVLSIWVIRSRNKVVVVRSDEPNNTSVALSSPNYIGS